MKNNISKSKILIIGVSFNDSIGVGITLKNLFSKFKPNQIAVMDCIVNNNDLIYSENLFNIKTDEKIVVKSDSNEKIIEIKSEILKKKNLNLFKIFLLSFRKYLAYYYNNYFIHKLTPNLKKFISDFNPTFIYLVPYNRKIINRSLRISELYDVPIVTHFMDDFRKRSPKDIFYYLNEYIIKQKINLLVTKSYKCLAICDFMSDEYGRIFNKKFYSFHNPIQIIDFLKYNSSKRVYSSDNIKIVYTGTIAENNYDTLIFFSSICENLSKGGNKIYFDIYSPYNKSNVYYQRVLKSIKDFKFISLKDRINHNKIIPTLFNYNLLLLPLSFNKKFHSVIEYSFPTKVAEYMVTGIPTLYIIPKQIALHSYLNKNNFGYLIDELDKIRIETFLISFITNMSMQIEDTKAKELAYSNFNLEKVASDFENIFS